LEIPRIIHQVFHNWKDPGNETLPADWEAVRMTCVEKNKDWEYMVSWGCSLVCDSMRSKDFWDCVTRASE
jgi:hypothetical protein